MRESVIRNLVAARENLFDQMRKLRRARADYEKSRSRVVAIK